MATTKKATKKKAPAKTNPLQAPVQPDEILAAALGTTKPLPRTDITKKLWAYIKDKQLQDPNDKRTIIADDRLRPLFGKKKVTMFEMTKIVNQHVQ